MPTGYFFVILRPNTQAEAQQQGLPPLVTIPDVAPVAESTVLAPETPHFSHEPMRQARIIQRLAAQQHTVPVADLRLCHQAPSNCTSTRLSRHCLQLRPSALESTFAPLSPRPSSVGSSPTPRFPGSPMGPSADIRPWSPCSFGQASLRLARWHALAVLTAPAAMHDHGKCSSVPAATASATHSRLCMAACRSSLRRCQRCRWGR